MTDPDSLNLDQLASRTMRHADKLRDISQRLHGYEDPETGQKYPGVKLRFEEALDAALLSIHDSYEMQGKRPPAEDIRAARARTIVKENEPDLWDEYHALEATLRRIQRWLRDADSAIRARQSVLKTEREFAAATRGA